MAITLIDSGYVSAGYGSSITYPEPSTFAADDLWVLAGTLSINVDVSAYPTGFTQRYKQSSNGYLYLAYKKMTGSESGTVSVTHTGDEQYSATWAVFRGVDTTTPFDVADGAVDGGYGTAPSFDSLTTTTDGAWVLSHLGAANNNDPTVTYDSDQTEITTTDDKGGYCWTGFAYEELATAGAHSDYGSLSLSISTGWTTMISALRPAAASGISVPVAMHYHKMSGVN